MAITGQSGDGTCEVHGCQLERLRNEVQRLTEALTDIGEECRKFPIKDGLAFRIESMTLNALKSTEPKP